MDSNKKYCESLTERKRLPTLEVKVGNIGIGGQHPIRVQSMTTTDTMDTQASVDQAMRMIEAGCEIVRYTAPSKKDAENLLNIKNQLVEKGYNTPLVADIHFTPNAAEIAAEYVEKVRVNPGNYADKKKFETHDYSDESYQAELDRIREKFTPLVLLCKENGRAMRIGTNHGSLSDRILSRYGDTPQGMVESALEFVDICEDNGYFDLVISMKASNPQVMVQAYRLLVSRMYERGRIYPLHVGVTEAGEGEDGRIKSAIGIGALLEDGLGDTIRVSLTEEPEAEIPVAQKLVDRYKENGKPIEEFDFELPFDPYSYSRRESNEVLNIGDHHVPVVIADLSSVEQIKQSHLFSHGYHYHVKDDKWNINDSAVDFIYIGSNTLDFEIPGTLGAIQDGADWNQKEGFYPLFDLSEFENALNHSKKLNFLKVNAQEIGHISRFINVLKLPNIVILLQSENPRSMADFRRFIGELIHQKIKAPVILTRKYMNLDNESFQIHASTDLGGPLIDGLGDGVYIQTENCSTPQLTTSTAFGILQATRTRISRTEYISCPSCGRTLFDLQETTAKIRAKTDHLKGLKIGIMGCIVNGPGEMADADYGYVGVGKGKINLYKEKEVVKRNIPEEKALDELIELIREYGEWVEPK